jgi:predicted kinase
LPAVAELRGEVITSPMANEQEREQLRRLAEDLGVAVPVYGIATRSGMRAWIANLKRRKRQQESLNSRD